MPTATLRRRSRLVLAGLCLVCLLFGGLVVFKSVLLHRRQGDLGCYCRGGWAIRQGGGPLYQVLCDNHWHYNYPPLFAILMVPLADPPHRDLSLTAGAVLGLTATPNGCGPLLAASAAATSPAPLYPSERYYLPYAASVVIFYLLSVLFLVVAVHQLARVVEDCCPPAADGEAAWRRFWCWRLLPVVICLPMIGLTLVRGQVQTLLLLLIVGVIVGLLRKRSLLAGACIGAALCLKLFPAFLVVLPLWRRDVRALAGCTLAVIVGLAVVPVVVLGPRQTVAVYREYAEVLILPALGLGDSGSRSAEMIDAAATQSQAFQIVLHKSMHLHLAKMPPRPATWVKLAHWSIGAVLTLLTLPLLRRRQTDGLALVAGVGMLALVMVMLSPVCHLHYFTVGLPVVLAVSARLYDKAALAGKAALAFLFVGMMAAWSAPMIPGLGVLRDVGVPLAGALLLWLLGLVTFWPVRTKQEAPAVEPRGLAA
jgi:hypothetical protein